ncbi:hypothetical protein ACFE04_006943 [Oxalis oulophora]
MAYEIQDQSNVIKGAPLVQPNDKLFWFSSPEFVLTLLHYTLFMNAFELGFLFWVTLEYGVNSCYHEDTVLIISRILFALTVQVMSSYVLLPLYALITQMGSSFKSVMLEEQTMYALRQWHDDVKQKNKKKKKQEMSRLASNSNSSRPKSSSSNMGLTFMEIEIDNTGEHVETHKDEDCEIISDMKIEMSEISNF